MTAPSENQFGLQLIEPTRLPEYSGNILRFEGVNIQMDKGQWMFGKRDDARVIDTYSIWNPAHHEEIANRLAGGQRCAMYIMGNYGMGQIIESPEWITEKSQQSIDDAFGVKKRDKAENFVAFLDPDDAVDIIDFDKLPDEHHDLRLARKRHGTYAGPQHNIFPIKDNGIVNDAVIKVTDGTIGIFWIPGHWGYEEIAGKLRKKVKHGVFGGGSLNIHGNEPSYVTRELYAEMLLQPDWQEKIDFVLFDEIAEAGKVGRSQTMVRFTTFPPEIARVGSLSAEAISLKTGHEVMLDQEGLAKGTVRKASSLTQYTRRTNETSDKRVDAVMQRIARYKKWYKESFSREHAGFHFPFGRVGHPAT